MTAYLGEASGYDAGPKRTESGGTPIEPQPVNTYQAEIEEFSAALLARRESALSARLGLRSLVVLAASYKSARTGKRVQIT